MASKRPVNRYDSDIWNELTDNKRITLNEVWNILFKNKLDLVKEINYKSLFREPLGFEGAIGKVGYLYQWGTPYCGEAYICLNGEKQLYQIVTVELAEWLKEKKRINSYGYKGIPVNKRIND